MVRFTFEILRFVAVVFLIVLWTASVGAEPPGGKGGGNGKGNNKDEDPPSYNLPPFQYEVEIIDVEGMGKYYDTNDYGVSAISARPDLIAQPISTSRSTAAAIVYPVENEDGSISSVSVYLDNEIDPNLPYDLGAAVKINNAEEVTAVGWLDSVTELSEWTSFLLTPNPDAEVDGFSYDIVPLPFPASAVRSVIDFDWEHLNEAGDVLYSASVGSTFHRYVRYANGTVVDLGEPNGEYSPQEINSVGTIHVGAWNSVTYHNDYLLTADGMVIYPENLDQWQGTEIRDLAENGFSCSIEGRFLGYKKIKGKDVPQYKQVPAFHDPLGQTYLYPFREDMDYLYYTPLRISEILVGGQPVVMGGAGMVLNYPGYDAAYVRELMSPEEQAKLDALDFGSISIDTLASEGYFKITTPRNLDGSVDDSSVPSLWEGAHYEERPGGISGFQGIYVIRPILP